MVVNSFLGGVKDQAIKDKIADPLIQSSQYDTPQKIAGAKQLGIDIANSTKEITSEGYNQQLNSITNLTNIVLGGAVGMAGGKVGEKKGENVKDVYIDKNKYPESSKHIEDAQSSGRPSELTIDRSGASSRRRESLKDVETKPNLDRDEYPPAMFEEGGSGSSVRHINPSDNRGSGACIGAQCKVLPDGSKVNIKVKE